VLARLHPYLVPLSLLETVDPPISVLGKILDAAGLDLDVRMVYRNADYHTPVDDPELRGRHTIAQLASAIRERLAKGTEDRATLCLYQANDNLKDVWPISVFQLILDEPESTGDHRYDAYLAALVEHYCAKRKIITPAWTKQPWRFAMPMWFTSDNEALQEQSLSYCPAAFVRHGVLIVPNELESV